MTQLSASAVWPVIVRLRTPRLWLRAWRSTDAAALAEAIMIDGGAHLQRWMRWARNEPEPLETKAANLRTLGRRTLLGRDMAMGVFDEDEQQVIGAVGSHPRIGAGAREIGYWIRADRLREGFATEAAAAMVRIGFESQRLRFMEIHTDPLNEPSMRVAQRLGFRLQVIVRNGAISPEAPLRDDAIFTLNRSDYPASPAASLALAAYDRRGRHVL